MQFDLKLIEKLNSEYGLPLYVFCEQEFIDNYKNLEISFISIYKKYLVSYSF